MRKKGVYPYDYVDGPDRMKETQLSPIETFYGKLNESKITQDKYDHACTESLEDISIAPSSLVSPTCYN